MAYRTIEERLDSIETMLKKLLFDKNIPGELDRLSIVTVNDIAKMFGCSRSALYANDRFRLPGFGEVSEGKKKRWTLGEVLDWNAKPEDELREEYKQFQIEKAKALLRNQ